MRKFLCFIYISLFVFSCSDSAVDEKPDPFLNKEALIDVIVDVQILEAHYHNKYQRPDVYANALDSATTPIFESHQITKQIFEDNLAYQAKNPDTLYAIYEAALDTINNRLNSLKN